MASRQDYIDAAMGYLGARWGHAGRTARRIDCVGLVLVPAIAVGLADETWDMAYTRQPFHNSFVDHFRKFATREISIAERRPGSVLIFRDTLNPLHCGIFFEHNRLGAVLHADARRRQVTIDPWEPEMRPKAFSTCFDMNFEDL